MQQNPHPYHYYHNNDGNAVNKADSEEVKEFKTSLVSQPEKMLAFLREFVNYCNVDLKQTVRVGVSLCCALVYVCWCVHFCVRACARASACVDVSSDRRICFLRICSLPFDLPALQVIVPKKESADASMKEANDAGSDNESDDESDSNNNQENQPAAAAHEKFTALHYAVQSYAQLFYR